LFPESGEEERCEDGFVQLGARGEDFVGLLLSVGRGFLPRFFADWSLRRLEAGARVFHVYAALINEKVEKRAEHAHFKIYGSWGNSARVLLAEFSASFDFVIINIRAGDCLHKFLLSQMPLKVPQNLFTFGALDTQASQLRLEVLVAPFQLDTPSKKSDWIRVVSDQNWNDKPRWSPDGNRIYSRTATGLPAFGRSPGARNQAPYGAISARLPPAPALDPECWLRPNGYFSRRRQNCTQPG